MISYDPYLKETEDTGDLKRIFQRIFQGIPGTRVRVAQSKARGLQGLQGQKLDG